MLPKKSLLLTMQTSLKTFVALTGAVLLQATVSAADSSYARVGAALFVPTEDDIFGAAPGILVAAGQNFGPHSVELEVGYVKFSESQGGVGSADLEVVPLTLGYRYNFEVSDKLSIGVGANAGIAFTKLSASLVGVGSGSDRDSVFIWSAGLRAKYAFSEKVALSAGYRYMFVEDLEYNGVTLEDADTHVFELGLEFAW